MLVLSIVGSLVAGLGGIWGVFDLLISAGSLVGLFAYAYHKRVLNAAFWEAYLPVLVVWDFSYNLVIQPRTTGESFDPITLIVVPFIIPIYVGLYLYGFKALQATPSRAGK